MLKDAAQAVRGETHLSVLPEGNPACCANTPVSQAVRADWAVVTATEVTGHTLIESEATLTGGNLLLIL